MRIHQILPSLSPGDAIGNEVLLIRDLLRSWGYDSEIFAQHIHPDVKARYFKDYKSESSKNNILIYHFSIGSDISEFIKNLPDKKIMIYHNITPPHFFWNINDNLMFLLKKGRDELKSLSQEFKLALADSEYNRKELEAMGYRNTAVLPLIIDFSKYNSCNPLIISEYSDEWTNILFVGRVSPNKKHEDIIKIFYYYKCINPKSRLFFIGGYEGCEPYYGMLLNLIKKLGLSDVYFRGKVPFEDLISYYKISDVFLCMSEHEGFNVPLLESMFFELPIIAYNSSAIPYTLGDAGILVNKKEYCEIAEFINYFLNDSNLIKKILDKQSETFKMYHTNISAKKFRKFLKLVHER